MFRDSLPLPQLRFHVEESFGPEKAAFGTGRFDGENECLVEPDHFWGGVILRSSL